MIPVYGATTSWLQLIGELDDLFFGQSLLVPVEQWHAQDVKGNPDLISRELRHVILEIAGIPETKVELQDRLKPSIPWAEDQFLERVSGEPLNPPPSEAWWPYAVKGNAAHKDGEVFSHSYPERYWPRFANEGGKCADSERVIAVPIVGIRYEYGDLYDVVELLRKYPLTRQAYLPVFFPEDTGAVSGQRLPCSLGYHFLRREGKVDVDYFIRSCDYMRHFTDDVYMTARLMQWMCGMIGARPGRLVMHIGSFHIFQGDLPMLKKRALEREDDDDVYC